MRRFLLEERMETSYPYNMVLLRRFYLNHFFLDNVNAALELDYMLKAVLPKLAVKTPEFETILASKTKSRLDFDIALNASKKQEKSTIAYQLFCSKRS